MAPGAAAPARAFPPAIGPAPRILVLGSLPGTASLAAGEYYAHPRNLFWDFMGELFGAGRELPYAERLRRLGAAGVALWDVVAEARRAGSLDSRIELATARHADVAALLLAQPTLRCVAFNGGTAARLFARVVEPGLPASLAALRRLPLPSTSPANAALPRAMKLAAWRDLLEFA